MPALPGVRTLPPCITTHVSKGARAVSVRKGRQKPTSFQSKRCQKPRTCPLPGSPRVLQHLEGRIHQRGHTAVSQVLLREGPDPLAVGRGCLYGTGPTHQGRLTLPPGSQRDPQAPSAHDVQTACAGSCSRQYTSPLRAWEQMRSRRYQMSRWNPLPGEGVGTWETPSKVMVLVCMSLASPQRGVADYRPPS